MRSGPAVLRVKKMTDGMSDKGAAVFCSTAAELLQSGNGVRFSAPGYSMHPVIMPSDVLHVAPIRAEELFIGDIALYRAGDRIIAHRVVRIQKGEVDRNGHFGPFAFSASRTAGPLLKARSAAPQAPRSFRLTAGEPPAPQVQSSSSLTSGEPPLQITLKGDACSTPDPPVTAEQILGKVISVERHGRHVDAYRLSCTLNSLAYRLLSRLIRFFR